MEIELGGVVFWIEGKRYYLDHIPAELASRYAADFCSRYGEGNWRWFKHEDDDEAAQWQSDLIN